MSVKHQVSGLATITLDSIVNLFHHPKTKTISGHLIGKEFMCKFPGGQLYFESKLDLDTDGSVFHRQDGTGQGVTSARFSDNSSLDADLVNYFVLPEFFSQPHGIRIGDIGVVIFGIRKVFACFGDVGPSDKLGEGSIALHRELGHETIVGRDTAAGGRLINAGISSGVITIVFPGSGNGLGRENLESSVIGGPLFQKLQQEGDAVGDFPSPQTSSYA